MQTGVGKFCAPGDKPGPRWVVNFDDADRGWAMYDREADARAGFATAEGLGWNCYLWRLESRSHSEAPAEPVAQQRSITPGLLALHEQARNLVAEANAIGTMLGDPQRLYAAAVAVRDAIGGMNESAAIAAARAEGAASAEAVPEPAQGGAVPAVRR